MLRVLALLRGAQLFGGTLGPAPGAQAAAPRYLSGWSPRRRAVINLPFRPEPCLVGRDTQIETVLTELERDAPSRVLIGGEPGMGKDVVAVQALHDERARALVRPALRSFMPYWLPATTADDLRGKLRQLGVDHLGADPTADQEAVLKHVRTWLAHEDNAGWLLYLEDLNTESYTELREWVPDGAPGRLLVTSNQQLGKTELGAGWAEVTLDELKAGEGVGDNEALQLLDKVCHQLKSRPYSTTSRACNLAAFFDKQLGNLPLSVSIVAHLLATKQASQPYPSPTLAYPNPSPNLP